MRFYLQAFKSKFFLYLNILRFTRKIERGMAGIGTFLKLHPLGFFWSKIKLFLF